MRELPIIDDKRLLGALDYIDERFVAEVTEEYEIFDTAPGAKLPPRARMYRFRQFAALAACLILLSFASLGVNYVANAVISFAASAGGSNTETSGNEQDFEKIDSPYERSIDAYPDDMPITEIYEDVLKGGWAVLDSVYPEGFIAGGDLMLEFLERVNAGTPSTMLVADYVRYWDVDPDITGWTYSKPRRSTIFLMEIVFDGNVFNYRRLDCATDEITDSGEYKYLIEDIREFGGDDDLPQIKSGYRVTYCLSNESMWTFLEFKKHAYTDEGRTEEFFSNPCQIIASYVPMYETFDGGTIFMLPYSLGFSELIVD